MLENIQIHQLLTQYNPWWNNGGHVEEVPQVYRRAYNETLQTLNHREIRRFVILTGARRVGKTTIMKQVIDRLLTEGVPPQHILYLSFDNPMLKLLGFRRVIEAYDQYIAPGEQKYMFLDEIQYAEDWSLWLKTLYDTRPGLRVVATGSASPSIEKGASDSGVGRWRLLRMPTLTFREYCDILQIHPACRNQQFSLEELAGMQEEDLRELMQSAGDMQAHWNHYMAQGGFPELLRVSSTAQAQMVLREDVVDKVLKRDVPSLFDVRNTLQLEKIFLYLCLHSGSIINMAAMCSALGGVSLPTLQRYIEYLRDANLIYTCPNINKSGKKGLSAQEKIYVADVSLRHATLMTDPRMVCDSELGSMVESIVYKHLMYAYGSRYRLGYLRLPGRDKPEVDFALAHPAGGNLLCEVKYKNDSSITRHDAIAALSAAPETKAAFLITRQPGDYGTDTILPQAKPIIRIPAATFCYLLHTNTY